MKKILFIICLSILSLFSCSSEADSSDDSNDSNIFILPKRVTEIVESENYIYIVEYSYIGNKVDKKYYYDDGSAGLLGYEKYHYEGNNIIKIEGFDPNDNYLGGYSDYVYDDWGKLIQIQEHSIIGEDRTFYLNYNSDRILTIKRSNYDFWNKYYFDANGQQIKSETFYNSELTITKYYTYDHRNHPFKNVIGLEYGYYFHSINNVNFYEYESYSSSGSSIINFDFNSNNYPVLETSIDTDNGFTKVIKYEY